MVHWPIDAGVPRKRIYALLALYAQPISMSEPVICIDEKSVQLHWPQPCATADASAQAPEGGLRVHVRKGTSNLFLAVEPKAGQRIVLVTAQRGKADFVAFVGELLTNAYAKAGRFTWL